MWVKIDVCWLYCIFPAKWTGLLLVTFLLQKITTKNAFGLHLIDYMADILKQKDSELNFKVETCRMCI